MSNKNSLCEAFQKLKVSDSYIENKENIKHKETPANDREKKRQYNNYVLTARDYELKKDYKNALKLYLKARELFNINEKLTKKIEKLQVCNHCLLFIQAEKTGLR